MNAIHGCIYIYAHGDGDVEDKKRLRQKCVCKKNKQRRIIGSSILTMFWLKITLP